MNMSGSYSVLQYMMPGLILLGGMLVLFILYSTLGTRLAKRYERSWIIMAPGMLLLCGFLITMYGFRPSLEPTEDLFPKDGYEIRKNAGVLEKITPVQRNWLCKTDYWTINGEQYFILSGSPAEEGMYVLVEYAATEDRVIFHWQESDPDAAAMALKEQAQADLLAKPEPEQLPEAQPIPQWRGTLGLWVSRFGSLITISAIIAFTGYRNKITLWLLKRDTQHEGGIVRDPVGILFNLLPFVCSFLILGGAVIAGGIDELVLLIIFTVMALFLWRKTWNSSLTIDGQNLIVCEGGKEQCYTVGSVLSVRWKTVKGFTGKALEVVFATGKTVSYDIDTFMGVQYTYTYLKQQMEKT